MKVTPKLAHQMDASGIIALWKAIYGGDPSVEQIAAQTIHALTLYLDGGEAGSVEARELNGRVTSMGRTVTDYQTRSGVPKETTVLLNTHDPQGGANVPLRCYKEALSI